MTELPIDENTPRILIVEDEPKLGQLLIDYLRAASYAPTLISHGDQVLPYVRQTPPDLILLDLMLPGTDGLTLCREIRRFSDIPIVMVTAKIEEIDCLLGLEIGADDYICKPFNPLELVARVKSNLRRYTSLGSLTGENKAIYQVGGLVLNDDTKQVTVDDEPVKMTPIEYNILLLLMKNQGRVFSINQIYESIWNEDAIGADNTVAVHIRHIREKIEINPKEPRYLKVVWGVGYKIDKEQA